ncbi:hypothetical protein SAMN04489864_11068 [Pedobacter insulae]|uniref:Uncharacterized protein n=2 Tax=Pedobacter insulae TaxID=414048 RepID=A0A1I2ZIZ8_9SPHI|nr:hypothetical protein SAMN04489864_11068 [Pedobacter insulae]
MNELFKNITWTQYLLVVGGAAFIYYLLVLLLYFRKEVWKKLGLKEDVSDEDEPIQSDGDLNENTGGELMDDLERTVKEIGHSILVPGNKATKPELIDQLKASVANFGGLSRPGYRYALNNYIMEKARENCGINLSEEELEEAWKSLSR